MKPAFSVVCRVTFIVVLMEVAVCALTASTTAPAPQKPPTPLSEAVDEFKTLTREMGIRPESPPSAQEHHGPKMLWHGRVYENFRNDILDAIPHEVKQNGETASPLRRNQFGFNISG